MRGFPRTSMVLRTVALFVATASVLPTATQGQPPAAKARALIDFLTYQSEDRRGKPIVYTSGLGHADRDATRALVLLGREATPELERALDFIEQEAPEARAFVGAENLLAAYARIEGGAAKLRLLRMMENPRLIEIRINLDDAIALSMGLTSYVSDARPLESTISSGRDGEPRDPLDQVIMALAAGNRPLLESALGETGRLALVALKSSIPKFHRPFGSASVAVGYRFDGGGHWAEPKVTVDPKNTSGHPLLTSQTEFRLNTVFTDRFGANCGKQEVAFAVLPRSATEPHVRYLVDDPNLGEILETIARCAAQNR